MEGSWQEKGCTGIGHAASAACTCETDARPRVCRAAQCYHHHLARSEARAMPWIVRASMPPTN